MKLFVFDLDFTIWDAGGTWCDCTYPPYLLSGEIVLDVDKREIRLYPEVREILRHLSAEGKLISIASRTTSPAVAGELLRLFEIEHHFFNPQIYPDSKVTHFKKIKEAFGVEYKDMVFFDDEFRNIREVSELGVICEYLSDCGLCWDVIRPYL